MHAFADVVYSTFGGVVGGAFMGMLSAMFTAAAGCSSHTAMVTALAVGVPTAICFGAAVYDSV
jgi:hypothetical protein